MRKHTPVYIFNINLISDNKVIFMRSSRGISTVTENEEINAQYSYYKDQSESNLINLERSQLIDILRQYGHFISGAKP